MKKYLKFVGRVLVVIVLIYILFVIEESVRLSKNSLAEPLIILEESYSGNIGNVTYKSLGFTLKVNYAKFNDSDDIVYPISQEFWLFNAFLIWGWIN